MHPAIRAARIHLSQITPRWMKAARTHALIALADKMEPRMRDSFLRAVDEMKSKIDMKALTQSIANNDRVLSSMAIGDKAWGKLLEQSAKIPAEMFNKAGQIGAAGLKNQFNISASFTMQNPRAQAWARTNSSKLITQIGGETRKGIQQVIGSAYQLGLPSKETARVIREMVGLTEKQGAAVFNFRERLVAQGRKPDQVARMTTKYEAKLLKYRSENIARTEIAKAGNEGLIESWRQAADTGLLDANNTNVEWLAAFDDRVCPICAPLNGTVYSYKDIESGKSAAPPAHPMCRCTLGISFEPVTAVKPAVNVPVANLEEIAASTADAVVGQGGLVEAKHDLDYFNQAAAKIVAEEQAIMDGPVSSFNRNQDVLLNLTLKEQGFDALPTLVTSSEAESLELSGWNRVYRGVKSSFPERLKEMIKAFESGDLFAGLGTYGGGTYTSNLFETALDYAGNNESGVMELLINPKAKFIEYGDLINLRNAFNKLEHSDDLGFLQTNLGTFAAMSGYDGIIVNSPRASRNAAKESYRIILNRSAVAKVVK